MATVNISDLLHLSIPERIQLAADLWDSIAADPGALPVTEAERREVLRRSEAHHRNPDEAVSLEKLWNTSSVRLGELPVDYPTGG